MKGTAMKRCLIMMALFGIVGAPAQEFVNLDFENANLSSYNPGLVPVSDAIPSWTAYLGGVAQANIYYDATPNQIGIYIYDSTALQGDYSVLIQGTPTEPASIGQTGTIPATAQSLTWWGIGAEVSFEGQPLPFSAIGYTTHYTIYEADVSAFAGQTGQLLFTSSHFGPALGETIDNIQFSLIPEPGVSSLLALGGLSFIYHRRKSKSV
jgi:hypothetical protein